jgi:S1-C subfamily serine protease
MQPGVHSAILPTTFCICTCSTSGKTRRLDELFESTEFPKGHTMSATMHELSENIATLVRGVGPHIVRIDGRRRLAATGVIYSQDGLIVTAHHVVERDDALTVGLDDGTTHDAELIGRDPNSDIALLRVKQTGLTPAQWTEPSALAVGHLVLALGRPGKSVQATLGVISALGGAWRTPAGAEVEHYLQTDVAMYPGFSGGPLLTADGSFAGINSSSLVRGISVALPKPTIVRVVNTLLAHGQMPRGFLGVGIQPVRLAHPLGEQSSQETGLMVMSVEQAGPADAAGIIQGDILISANATTLRHVDDLQAFLSSTAAGSEVTIRLARSGELQTRPVTIGQAH